MENENKMTERMTAPVTKSDKAKYKKLADEIGINEADLVRRSLEYYCVRMNQVKEELFGGN